MFSLYVLCVFMIKKHNNYLLLYASVYHTYSFLGKSPGVRWVMWTVQDLDYNSRRERIHIYVYTIYYNTQYIHNIEHNSEDLLLTEQVEDSVM